MIGDLSILRHIVSYCNQIEQTTEHFGNTYESFSPARFTGTQPLCVSCKLAGKLSDAFRAQNSIIPWRQIKAMRNIVAHSYGTVDPETTWEIICADIPRLKNYCLLFLTGSSVENP